MFKFVIKYIGKRVSPKFCFHLNNVLIDLVLPVTASSTPVEYVIRPDNLPVIFKCQDNLSLNPSKPTWINQEFISPVYWSVCPSKNNYDSLRAYDKMSIPKCVQYTISKWEGSDENLGPVEITKMTGWTYVVNEKGELIIFHFQPNQLLKEYTYSLLCYKKHSERANMLNIFYKELAGEDIKIGVVFNSSIVNTERSLKAISPEWQNVSLYSRTVSINCSSFYGFLNNV